MKKIILSLAAICMVVSSVILSSCSKDDETTETIACVSDFTYQTTVELEGQYKASVVALASTMNAKIVEIMGQEKFLLDAQEVNGALTPTSEAIQTLQNKIINDAAIQEMIAQLKALKADATGKTAAVSHLNFNIYNANDSNTCYWSNSIF